MLRRGKVSVQMRPALIALPAEAHEGTLFSMNLGFSELYIVFFLLSFVNERKVGYSKFRLNTTLI